MEPKIVATDRIPTEAIDPDALKVIRRLRNYGHEAYLVGGCVRDLLAGLQPKDFDVITAAKPRQVRRLFANSRVIGRRFRLVHVIFGENVIEVSTFRADPARLAAAGAPEAAVPGFGEEEEAVLASAERADGGPGEVSDVGALSSDEGELDVSDEGELDVSDEGELPDEGDLDASDEGALSSDEGELDAPDVGVLAPRRGPPPPPGPGAWSDMGAVEGVEDGPRGGARPDDFDLNNLFGDPEQDAWRRDFTVNALFYDPSEKKIIDYTGGLEDVDRRLLRTIRDADVSFPEDPVRMIRAARFAAKLEFEIEPSGRQAILDHRQLLTQCSQRRLLEEVFKILKGGHAARSVELMDQCGLLPVFLPEVAEWLASDPNPAGRLEEVATPAAGGEPQPEAAQELAPAPVQEPAGEEPAEEEPVEEEPPEEEPVAEEEEASVEAGAAPAPQPAEPATAATPSGEPEEEPPHGRSVAIGGGPDAFLYPEDEWTPDERLVKAYLRVTWERPPVEGANDWVEDPHVHMMDDMFEAASFSRDAYLERTRFGRMSGEAAERARAAAVLRVLRWNGRLREIVASFPEDELQPRRSRRRRRRRGGGNGGAPPVTQHALGAPQGVGESRDRGAAPLDLSGGLSRRQLLLGYLRALDLLVSQGVSPSNSLQLSALFGPLLLTTLEAQLAGQGRGQPAERLADDVLQPIARRHSLARRDRDGIKRSALHVRRLLSGELRRRGRGRVDRLLVRDHFREAVVLMWMHCKATGQFWDELRHWERRVKEARGRR